MSSLDQFRSEISGKLDALATADAAELQRERKWTVAMCTALLCVVTAMAMAMAVVYSCSIRL
jgi:hypothetical protein